MNRRILFCMLLIILQTTVARGQMLPVQGVMPETSGTTDAFVPKIIASPPEVWLRTFDNPVPQALDLFGHSVSLSGDRALIGAYLNDSNGVYDAGSAYLFDTATGALLQTFDHPAPQAFSYFGNSVSLSGNRALIGAHQDDPNGVSDAGSAYLFDTATGALLHTLDNPDPQSFDLYGYSVSLSGDRALIGAYADDPNGVNSAGSGYLFDAATGSLLHTLDNPDPQALDSFGYSVSLSGDRALIGAHQEDPNGVPNAGSAYLFDTATGSLSKTFDNPAPQAADLFGRSVSLSGDRALIGAEADDPNAVSAAGSAYLFDTALPPQVSLSQAQAFLGDETSVALSVEILENLAFFTAVLSYDPLIFDDNGTPTKTVVFDAVHPIAPFPEALLTTELNEISPTKDQLVIHIVSGTEGTLPQVNTQANINFQIAPNGLVGIGDLINLSFDSATLVYEDGDFTTITPGRTDGGITVIDQLYGDVNLNGVYDGVDVLLIIRIVVGLPTDLTLFQQFVVADANQDDVVDLSDALFVLNNLSVPKLIPASPGSAPITVTAPGVDTQAGDRIFIPIQLDTEASIHGVDISLQYDTEALTFDEMVYPEPQELMVQNMSTPGIIRLAGITRQGFSVPNGELMGVYFIVREAGTHQIQVDQVMLLASDGSKLAIRGITEGTSVPGQFKLHQNTPNPFNPSTTVRYDLPKESEVRLFVYNVLGQQVELLSLGMRPAGRHEVVWDASRFTSGLYLFRIEAGTFRQTIKMTLLK